ncbi:MAG: DUF6524 family protein [Pseudomonadota bacterium]
MSRHEFTPVSFLLRWLFALALVLGTYNPTEFCYTRWVLDGETSFGPVTALVGIALLIVWIVFLRATFMSMGWLGIILGAAFFGCVVWLFIDWGLLSFNEPSVLTWVVLVVLSLILATGMSWSHIRRRLSGQFDVDELED